MPYVRNRVADGVGGDGYEWREDPATAVFAGPVRIVLRNLSTEILDWAVPFQAVVGCFAWVTSPVQLRELAKREFSQIVCQKEEWMRDRRKPPTAACLFNGKNKVKFRDMRGLEDFPRNSECVPKVKCFGVSDGNDARPLMHHKFLVGCSLKRDGGLVELVPEGVWVGSHNLTRAGHYHMDSAVVLESKEAAGHFLREWWNLFRASEPIPARRDEIVPDLFRDLPESLPGMAEWPVSQVHDESPSQEREPYCEAGELSPTTVASDRFFSRRVMGRVSALFPGKRSVTLADIAAKVSRADLGGRGDYMRQVGEEATEELERILGSLGLDLAPDDASGVEDRVTARDSAWTIDEAELELKSALDSIKLWGVIATSRGPNAVSVPRVRVSPGAYSAARFLGRESELPERKRKKITP